MIHFYYANNKNIGDFYSAKGIRLLLDRAGKAVPFEPHLAQAAQRLSRGRPPEFVIIGGGGLLMDYFTPFWESLLEWHEAHSRPYVLWGVGYCESKLTDTKGSRALLDEVIRRAALAGLRDKRTFDDFRHSPNASLIPCPSMLALQTDIHQLASAGNQPAHLLQVDHPDLLTQLTQSTGDDVARQITVACRHAAENLGVTHRHTSNMIHERFGRSLGRAHRLCEQLGIDPRSLAPIERLRASASDRIAQEYLLENYRDAYCIVTSRLHGAIIGFSLGKKVIAVSGDWKIDSFFASLGLDDWVTDDPATLPALLARIDEQPPVSAAVADMVSSNRSFADQVRALLPNHS